MTRVWIPTDEQASSPSTQGRISMPTKVKLTVQAQTNPAKQAEFELTKAGGSWVGVVKTDNVFEVNSISVQEVDEKQDVDNENEPDKGPVIHKTLFLLVNGERAINLNFLDP